MLSDVHQYLVHETNVSLSDFGEDLSATKIVVVKDLVKILQIDNSTLYLGKTNVMYRLVIRWVWSHPAS